MKIRFLFATLALLLMLALGSVACGGGDDDGGDSPGATDQASDDGGATDTPDPTGSGSTPVASSGTLGLDVWSRELSDLLAVAETADDEARSDHPNFATDPVEAEEFASALQGPVNELQNQLLRELNPSPEGLEDEFNALQAAIAVWTYAFPLRDIAAIESGLVDVQAACEPIQAFIDDAGEDVDLNCDFSD